VEQLRGDRGALPQHRQGAGGFHDHALDLGGVGHPGAAQGAGEIGAVDVLAGHRIGEDAAVGHDHHRR
jgi:hypothetical protein